MQESRQWISVNEVIPPHNERVLVFVPGNKVFLPGKSGEFEIRECIVLRLQHHFYPEGSDKYVKHGPHFWQGEGNSNHFFGDVSHWMKLPSNPI
ncbi:MAG: DUF551 domain-containing protein [Flavobacteriales bacterium]|nr:DUF551 domain-containing protein [Flavobacteriales bacterium]